MDRDMMDITLERSVRLLDDAIPKRNKLLRESAFGRESLSDLSINQTEAQLLMEHNESQSVISGATSIMRPRSRLERRTDQLYEQFLEILQTHTSDMEIFDTISDLTQAIIDTIDDVTKQTKRRPLEADWLIHEKNTWQLLFALYKDRLVVQKDEMEVEDMPLVNSEKLIVDHLYVNNSRLREYQLIVDWLEETSFETTAHVGHFSDRTIGWENTLHQLQSAGITVFGSKKDIVTSLDPDAVFREKKPLHDLDMEDEERLTKQIFIELRQGKFEEAQSLCEHYGQTWRAAVLEGWRLHHDPNFEVTDTSTLKQPIEGNPRRDLWKRCAWQMADNVQLDAYNRAIVGLFCGHLGALTNVTGTWADLLWSYLKVQIDIRVESEIRNCCIKSYLTMPETYWNNKLSLEQIFEELGAHKNPLVRDAAKNPVNVIQQFIILDDMAALMKHVEGWLHESTISAQMLRFLTHVILFMRQIGKSFQEEASDSVIRAYVESLIKLGNAKLIAFYTAALPSNLQVALYSEFLETINVTDDRRVAFHEATSHGLDIQQITFQTVDRIRKYEPETPHTGLGISSFDDLRIKALEWLTFHPEQICDLLWQANAFIRGFMAQSKTECIRATFKVVPNDAIKTLITFYGSRDQLPPREESAIKEYFCHQTYLAAIDGYNTWSDCFYNEKPKAPVFTTKPNGFTEKVAQDHVEQTYKADLQKWKKKLQDQTQRCRDLFYNILLFPDQGWLQEEPPHLEATRANQMDNLRKIVIPEIAMFLHKILTLSGNAQDCFKLLNVLAGEDRVLYQVYSKQKLADFLRTIAETSLTLMNEKKDPWGYKN